MDISFSEPEAAQFLGYGISWNERLSRENKFLEVNTMCNNGFGGNNCWWIIILILLMCNCGGSFCGNNNNSCGCDNNCGCC